MLTLVLISSFVFAQAPQNPCDVKCNQQASECMKTCAGDPKDAQKPDQSKRLVKCVQTCQEQTRQCKQGCRK